MRGRFAEYSGQKCSVQYSGGEIPDPQVHLLRNVHYPNNGWGVSKDPECLVTGSNSGFQALNVAALAGAAKVILLGYDGAPGPAGMTHWFGDHPRVADMMAYEYIRRSFDEARVALQQMGVRVINASPGTAVKAFERMPLDEALRV